MRITDLAGKAVLVTGASTGIGAAVAKGFAAQGARVAVHYNSSEAQALQVLEEIRAAGGDAIALRADVRSVDACQSLVAEAEQRLGALNVLVNNAGGVVKRHQLHDIVPDSRFEPWPQQSGSVSMIHQISKRYLLYTFYCKRPAKLRIRCM